MKNLYLAILSGVLLAVSWPTYGVSLCIFIAFVPLLWAEKKVRERGVKTKRTIFIVSYSTFVIWNAITTWWLWYSTQVGALFAILVNSLLMTIVFMFYHVIAKRVPVIQSLIFLLAIWISFEKFHLWWDISWPWLNLGNVFSEDILWIQWYEYTGTFGGTLWVLLVNSILYISLLRFEKTKNRKFVTLGFAKATLVIAIPISISFFMYKNYTNEGKPTQVIVLQPNIDPYAEKYELSNNQVADLLIDLTKQKIDSEVDFVITPETVFAQNIPYNYLPYLQEIQQIRHLIEKYPQVNFVGGVAMYQIITDKRKTTAQSNKFPNKNAWFNDYNSAFLLNKNDSIPLYHKSKLVVGVENLPYQNFIKPILGNVMIDLGGTVALKTTQPERSVFTSDKNQSMAPIICYETVYGEYVTNYVQKGAQFLGILTNDAWWRNTQGHKQLLSYTRLRAIETRKSVARSANTGISCFIDQKGDFIGKTLPYGTQGSLKATILLNDKITFYVKYGDYIARVAIFIAVGIFLIVFARKKEYFSFKN